LHMNNVLIKTEKKENLKNSPHFENQIIITENNEFISSFQKSHSEAT